MLLKNRWDYNRLYRAHSLNTVDGSSSCTMGSILWCLLELFMHVYIYIYVYIHVTCTSPWCRISSTNHIWVDWECRNWNFYETAIPSHQKATYWKDCYPLQPELYKYNMRKKWILGCKYVHEHPPFFWRLEWSLSHLFFDKAYLWELAAAILFLLKFANCWPHELYQNKHRVLWNGDPNCCCSFRKATTESGLIENQVEKVHAFHSEASRTGKTEILYSTCKCICRKVYFQHVKKSMYDLLCVIQKWIETIQESQA